jgi:hypothetical protein
MAGRGKIPHHPGPRRLRESFVPGPRGFRFYHTQDRAGADLERDLYSGLAGPVYIEPRDNPGAYDREIFLVLKELGPTISRGDDMDMVFLAGSPVPLLQQAGEAAMRASTARGQPKGHEVGYQFFAINGRMLGHGDPIRVRQGAVPHPERQRRRNPQPRSARPPFPCAGSGRQRRPHAGRGAAALDRHGRAHFRDRYHGPAGRLNHGRFVG